MAGVQEFTRLAANRCGLSARFVRCGEHVKEKGKVHHVELGTNISGDRLDRRGSRLWWNSRHGKLYRTGIVFRVPGTLYH